MRRMAIMFLQVSAGLGNPCFCMIPHQSSDLIGTKTRGRIDSALQHYIEEGGLPESLIYTSKREYLSTVLQKIILGDIVSRNNLKNDYTLKLLN